MHNGASGSVEERKSRWTGTGEIEAEIDREMGGVAGRNEERLLKGAELKQQNHREQRTGKPASQLASQPDGYLAGRLLTVKPSRSRQAKFTLQNFRVLPARQ